MPFLTRLALVGVSPRAVADPVFADDGSADPRLAAALAACAGKEAPEAELWALLGTARLLVPVVPVSTSDGGTDGVMAHGADMALVTVRSPDGRRVLPAFNGLQVLTRWNARARPVPVEGHRLAQAALGEGVDAVVIDLGAPTAYVLAGAPLRALAEGRTPMPAHQDREVLAALAAAAGAQPELATVSVRSEGGELVVMLQARGGVRGDDAVTAVQRLAGRLAGDPLLRSRLDRPVRLALLAG